jgi:hypothetical protein
VSLAEGRILQLDFGPTRNCGAEKRPYRLDVIGTMATPDIASGGRPAQHVDDLASEIDSISHDSVFHRGKTGRDRGQGGCGRGRSHRGDRTPLHRSEGCEPMAVCTQLVPAQTVENEKHDLASMLKSFRKPGGSPTGFTAENSWDQPGDVGAPIVGDHRIPGAVEQGARVVG